MNIEISVIPSGDATDDMAHGFPKFLQGLVFSTKDTKKKTQFSNLRSGGIIRNFHCFWTDL